MNVVKNRMTSRSRQAKGGARELFGRLTGKRRHQSAGRAERIRGVVRETTTEVADWAATAARDAQRRFRSR
ncbi:MULTISPECIES: CsbD family protein [Amycolatopsis]|uniref:CsbD family protein n=1 Tax=Amycolatopsis TaxID=1813 RepID=UPI00040DD2D0|nr:CsbD family protein [Amycolatopsis thermoflava]